MTPIQIINKSKHPLPHYATSQSAGMDIRANIDDAITLKPMERVLVKTGLFKIDASMIDVPVKHTTNFSFFKKSLFDADG